MFNDKINKILLYLFIFMVIIFISVYILKYSFKDNLNIDYFDNHDSILVTSEYYNLKGKTNSIKNIFINNKEYFLDENNNFNIKLYLFSGVNIFNLKAVKKNDDYIYKKITIIKKNN